MQLVSSVNGAVSRQCRQGELTTPIGGLKPGGVYRVKLNYGKDVIRKVVQLPHTKGIDMRYPPSLCVERIEI